MVVLIFLLYLAYVEEGYYDWSWTKDAGSWVFLFIAWNILFWFVVGLSFAFNTALKQNKTSRQKTGR